MKYFEDKIKNYTNNKSEIFSENFSGNETLSLQDVEEIDNLLSLVVMYKNSVLSESLKLDFEDKIKKLNSKLTEKELLTLLLDST